jgi:hypothetical protein
MASDLLGSFLLLAPRVFQTDLSEHIQLGKRLTVGTELCVACQASWDRFPGGSIDQHLQG